MVDFTKDKTWAATQTIENDADAGNIGKADSTTFSGDINSILISGFTKLSGSATNGPAAVSGTLLTIQRGVNDTTQIFIEVQSSSRIWFRRRIATVFQPWEEILHSGNTGRAEFNGTAFTGGENKINLDVSGFTGVAIEISTLDATSRTVMNFLNTNGAVGTIKTNGTATAYNTSSDPRLKDFKDSPADGAVDIEFNKLFSCFRVFNWKNDPTGDLVWGFDAHACVDAKLDIGSEGAGSRDLALGDVYNVIPAVIEPQDQQVVYKTGDKKGEPRFNPDGSPMMETVDVETSPEIEEKVSPAGVDQSKAVPILLAKIEQQDRFIAKILTRLDAAGL